MLSGLETEEVQAILARAPDECWAYQKPDDVLKRIKDIQTLGWCADVGSYKQSIHAISTPLRDSRAGVLAVMTLIGFPHELPPDQLAAPAKLLCDAARLAQKSLRTIGSTRVAPKEAKKK